jgi:hypothetical protein
MTPPALVYIGMGLLVARIMLDGRQTRGYSWLQWLQYLVDAARITLLWPLVLLVEKVTAWLKPAPEVRTVPSDLLPKAADLETPSAAVQAETPGGPVQPRRVDESRVFIFTGENKE